VVVTLTTISRTGATVVVAATRELPVMLAAAVRYPLRAARTVMVEEEEGDKPVTVTRPDDCDADPEVVTNEYV
jgi:hypothetical protein